MPYSIVSVVVIVILRIAVPREAPLLPHVVGLALAGFLGMWGTPPLTPFWAVAAAADCTLVASLQRRRSRRVQPATCVRNLGWGGTHRMCPIPDRIPHFRTCDLTPSVPLLSTSLSLPISIVQRRWCGRGRRGARIPTACPSPPHALHPR